MSKKTKSSHREISQHKELATLDDNVINEVFEYFEMKERVKALMACPRLYRNEAMWKFDHLEFEGGEMASSFISVHGAKVSPWLRSLTIGNASGAIPHQPIFGFCFPRLVVFRVCALSLIFGIGRGVLSDMSSLEHVTIDFGNKVWNRVMRPMFIGTALTALVDRERRGNPKLEILELIGVEELDLRNKQLFESVVVSKEDTDTD